MRQRLQWTIVATMLLGTATAFAHEFWLSPTKFRPARGETVDLALRDGMDYVGEPVVRNDLRIEKFVVLGPDGTEPVAGEDRKDPAGHVTLAKDGIYVIAYRGKRRSIELAAEKFEHYLREDGLEHVSKMRAERKETDKAGREVFSRCAKSLLKVGEGSKEGHDRVAGLRFEIVPETNPYQVAPGAEMAFRMVFDEKPLEGALVCAWSRTDPAHPVKARTDAAGRVKLKLDRAGEWLVSSVHMVVAPKDTGMDWESVWSSVTFDLQEPTPPGK